MPWKKKVIFSTMYVDPNGSKAGTALSPRKE
jgi:hypothetical protein